MSKLIILIGLLALAAPLAAHAQTPADVMTVRASSYQVEYDSLQRRAARVRSNTDSLITSFKSHFAGLAGTSRRTRSFAPPQRLVQPATGEGRIKKVLVKRQIAKHKSRNAEIEKVFYYGTAKRLLLYEYYEQHQLVHQRLLEYSMRNGRAYGGGIPDDRMGARRLFAGNHSTPPAANKLR